MRIHTDKRMCIKGQFLVYNKYKSESKPETARDNIFNPYNSCGIDNNNHHQVTANKSMVHVEHVVHQNPINSITQGADQLEKAISSRKRQRSEDESDRLVREALSQFYIPPQRLISAIEDCPLDIVNMGSISPKCPKMPNGSNDLELDFDMNQNQKEFEVIMDALRLGSPSPTPSVGSDTCGQAAMMSETNGGVFHNLVVTSLET
uniref:Uncharacterized protein n=1 Tax=Glossina brevipalpis TaxID=37001 RepID=A0A1A9WYF5_9MUSC